MGSKDLSYIVEQAVDDAMLRDVTTFKMYDFLKSNEYKRNEVTEFLGSPTALSVTTTVNDLELYLEGGQDNDHKQIREAYGHLGKPRARKIKDYLSSILSDSWQYEKDRKPGRRRKTSNK